MRTILYVDEHTASTKRLSTWVRGAGYRCLVASHPEEAERLFVANGVDLAILRHGTDGKFAEALAARLRKIRPVKVLMLATNAESEDVTKSVDLLLVRPETSETLLEAIAHLIEPEESRSW